MLAHREEYNEDPANFIRGANVSCSGHTRCRPVVANGCVTLYMCSLVTCNFKERFSRFVFPGNKPHALIGSSSTGRLLPTPLQTSDKSCLFSVDMSDHDTLDDFVLVEEPEWDVDSGSEPDSADQQQACSSVAAAVDAMHVLSAAGNHKGSFSAVLGAAADHVDMSAGQNQGSYAPDTDASKDVAHASTAEARLSPDQVGAAGAEAAGAAVVTNPRKLACESELQRLCHSVGHYIGRELSADLEYWRARLQTETAREQGQDAFQQHFSEVLTAAQKLCQTGAGEPTGAVPGWHWVQCSACRRCRLVSGAAFCELSLSDAETVFTCGMNTVDWAAPSCAEPSHFRVSA